jgi:hypothetical protein
MSVPLPAFSNPVISANRTLHDSVAKPVNVSIRASAKHLIRNATDYDGDAPVPRALLYRPDAAPAVRSPHFVITTMLETR